MSIPTASDLAKSYASSITSKTILITGPSPSSLGAHFVHAIAAHTPALLILAGRNLSKLQATADAVTAAYPEVNTRLLTLDLASLDSARSAAAEVNGWEDVPHVDVVVNNAGVMATKYEKTPEGYEGQFVANHLSHWLFTNLIMDKILNSDSSRIVNLTSDGHRMSGIRWGDPHFQGGETYNPWMAYGQSKTANMLTAISWAEKLGGRGVQAFSVHPGVIVNTNLATHFEDAMTEFGELNRLERLLGNKEAFYDITQTSITPEQGAATTVYAAFDPDLKAYNGGYLLACRRADPYNDTVKPWAVSSFEAKRLWKLSEELTGEMFSF